MSKRMDSFLKTIENRRPDLSHIKVPEGSKAVPLTQERYALVDEEDYDRVMKYNWHFRTDGYAFNNIVKLMHRFILNPVDNMMVDHINGDRLDNRKSNLRQCTRQENLFNSGPHRDSKSKYKGVFWDKGLCKWRAAITVSYKRKHLGCFNTEEGAAKAYDEAAKKLHKDFAKTNF